VCCLHGSLYRVDLTVTVIPSVMLDVQYRMHPSISRFPSSEFYQFSLQDGTVDADGNISPGLLPPASRHLRVDCETGDRPSIVFLDHAGSESVKDRSRVNLTEAYIVCGVVEDLLLKNEVRADFFDCAVKEALRGRGSDLGEKRLGSLRLMRLRSRWSVDC
jgi:superfamily I DNA and/or RNA helicase